MIGLIFFNYDAMTDPRGVEGGYKQEGNILWYSLSRILYTLGVAMILFALNTANFALPTKILGSTYMRALGRLSYSSALISPIIVAFWQFGAHKGHYISYYTLIHT